MPGCTRLCFGECDVAELELTEGHLRADLCRRQLDFIGDVTLGAAEADPGDEPLRDDEVDRRRDVESLHAHVDQASDSLGSRVCVEGGQHEVAGECRLYCDARRLEIADLADHDDVRILTQERAERCRESHADLGPHQHLIDSEEVVLDGIFRGHDVGVDAVDLGKGRIESGRFPRTRRPSDQQHPVRIRDRLHHLALGAGLEAERREVEVEVALVENSKNDLFAEQSR